jgi:hypothetical protein
MWVKQSTAATLIVGPILDSTGAEYTSAVIGDLSISKNGGTLTAMAAAATLTHIANGQYTLVTTTANLDTLGRCQITCNKSTYQMPEVRLMVVPAMVFDSLIAGSDRLDANVTHIADTAQTAGDLAARLPAALVSGRIDASVGAMAANVITATALASSAVSEIQSGLSTLDAAAVRTAIGLASANIDTQLTAILDEANFCLTILAGTISDAQTSAESYAITRNGSTYTIDFTGLDSTGNRGGQTLTKS